MIIAAWYQVTFTALGATAIGREAAARHLSGNLNTKPSE